MPFVLQISMWITVSTRSQTQRKPELLPIELSTQSIKLARNVIGQKDATIPTKSTHILGLEQPKLEKTYKTKFEE